MFYNFTQANAVTPDKHTSVKERFKKGNCVGYVRPGGVLLLAHVKELVDNDDERIAYVVVLEDGSETVADEKLLLDARITSEITVARQSQQNMLESAQAAPAVGVHDKTNNDKRVISSVL